MYCFIVHSAGIHFNFSSSYMCAYIAIYMYSNEKKFANNKDLQPILYSPTNPNISAHILDNNYRLGEIHYSNV